MNGISKLISTPPVSDVGVTSSGYTCRQRDRVGWPKLPAAVNARSETTPDVPLHDNHDACSESASVQQKKPFARISTWLPVTKTQRICVLSSRQLTDTCAQLDSVFETLHRFDASTQSPAEHKLPAHTPSLVLEFHESLMATLARLPMPKNPDFCILAL